MKTKIYLTFLLWSTLSLAHAQKTFMNTYVERTKVGPKMGTQLGVSFDEKYEIAAFFQRQAPMLEFGESSPKPRFYEKEFAGVLFAGSIWQRGDFNILMNARVGVSNKINFVITPSVVSEIKVTSMLSVQAGVGVRAFRPTAQFGIKISTQN